MEKKEDIILDIQNGKLQMDSRFSEDMGEALLASILLSKFQQLMDSGAFDAAFYRNFGLNRRT